MNATKSDKDEINNLMQLILLLIVSMLNAIAPQNQQIQSI